MLLSDIRAAFDTGLKDRFTSAALCEALNSMEGRAWAEFGKNGKPLTQNQLARLLKPFGVAPKGTIRVGAETAKGYHRPQFEGAWARYLSPDGGSEPSHRHTPDEIELFGISQPSQTTPDVTVGNREKTNNHGCCDGVTVAARVGRPARLCNHCGAPENADDPVDECSVGGETFLLHLGCRRPFADAPALVEALMARYI
jgi:hypothetical protein